MAKVTLAWTERGERATKTLEISAETNKHPGSIRIGRDPEQCDILLDCGRVSRLHAEISCDLVNRQCHLRNCRDANPIYVDGKPLKTGTAILQTGTTFTLGTQHLEILRVEWPTSPTLVEAPAADPKPAAPPEPVAASPVGSVAKSFVSLSQYIPLAFAGSDLKEKTFLLPGILTVIWAIALFASIGNTFRFNLLVALYLSYMGYLFIYRLCDKRKPIWVQILPAIATPILLLSPIWWIVATFFRGILPGRIPEAGAGFVSLFIAHFFGAGLAEELLKALPILAMMALSWKFPKTLCRKLAVREPLDGILLGASSGLGFTLIETLGQYVPNLIASASEQFGQGGGELLGLHLLIPRVVSSVFGHMAYSACFGYYIGLSVLKPRKRWRLLAVGYLLSSAIHALWNSSSSSLGLWVAGLVGILTYCLLTTTILKARELSPRARKAPGSRM